MLSSYQTELSLTSSDGSFIGNVSMICHSITLQDDDEAEKSGTATLTITALSENTRIVSQNPITIEVMDDDCK